MNTIKRMILFVTFGKEKFQMLQRLYRHLDGFQNRHIDGEYVVVSEIVMSESAYFNMQNNAYHFHKGF